MSLNIPSGIGYRLGLTDRTLGNATNTPEGWIVVNYTNNKVFIVSGGIWTDGGTIPGNGIFTDEYTLEWFLS